MNETAVRPKRGLLFVLIFLSGFAALVYEVLWLKELGLLFGNTAHAAATTLAVFFLGLAAGGRFFGGRASSIAKPLRVYGLLEFGIAASALLYFLLSPAFLLVYRTMYGSAGGGLVLTTLVKAVLAAGLLFLPAFFMGGTFPLMGQHLIRRRSELGSAGSLLYLVNTGGAALGAFVAGFFLPVLFGFRNSYLLAVTVNLAVGGAALWWARPREAGSPAAEEDRGVGVDGPVPGPLGSPGRIGALAFASGALTLGLEVLWTRMFAQVLHNSVYSFSAILVVFLLSLTLGSALANRLCRLRASPSRVLFLLLLLCGVTVGATPFLFVRWTNGLENLTVRGGLGAYVTAVFRLVFAVILLPGVLVGCLFPYLLKISEGIREGAGRTIGRLAAINGVGGIVGSLAAGFLALEWLGLWGAIQGAAIAYALLLPLTGGRSALADLGRRGLVAAGAAVVLVFADAGRLPVIRIDAAKGERLLEEWEGPHGTVAVIERGRDRKIKVDNHYALGGLEAYPAERRQAQIPLFLHPRAESVFFLGMGTGITAGAAFDFPVRRVVTCELIPEVVVAARRYFREYGPGLFDDARSTIVVEDGRHFLAATSESFDLIVSDLFIPWHAGAGTLYSRDHFRIARDRLAEGGLFVQWLPLFQLSRAEFDIIARTMLDVFPEVTLWRGDLFALAPTIGLVGRNRVAPIETEHIRRNLARVMPVHPSDRVTESDIMPYVLYAGNLGASRRLVEGKRINRDDRPVIEYLAPMTKRRVASGEAEFLTGLLLVGLFDDLFGETPPEEDPHLSRLTAGQRKYVRAGLDLYRAGALAEAGRREEASAAYRKFLEVIPFDIMPGLK